jgi:hypothetical protein
MSTINNDYFFTASSTFLAICLLVSSAFSAASLVASMAFCAASLVAIHHFGRALASSR